ncbi:GEMI7 protein, partial [Baryphthengus martii]|nr:GEMI7 protein [Baryphthengus martii]
PRAPASPIPMGILRLPRGPEGSGRGFDPASSPRFRASLPGSEAEETAEQGIRAALRSRYLRAAAAARDRPARFQLRGGIGVEAVFGASDVESGAFQVDALRPPLGVQAAAVLRGSDVVSYAFLL